MYAIKRANKFIRDLKRVESRGCDLALLEEVIDDLAKGRALDRRYCDHQLKGAFKDFRECHVKPDWLLLYRKCDGILFLVGTGTHADIYG